MIIRTLSLNLLALLLFIMMTTSSAAADTTSAAGGGATIDTRPGDGTTATPPSSDHQQDEPTPQTIEAYERLDKWKGCLLPSGAAPPISRMVYKHNKSRAASTGFPSRLQVGTNLGLSHHETAAIFGWTTGDYRMINPIARGDNDVEFDEYPFLPNQTTKAKCRLSKVDVMPYVYVLRSALDKLPALNSQKQQRLWRGHGRRIDQQRPGSIIVLKGFTSVTRDRDNALEFAAKEEGTTSSKQRTLLCILEHFSARCISKLSARPREYEVLFPMDKTFEVVDPSTVDTAHEDALAVRKAAERLREKMPGAEIDLVYVREVGRPSSSDGSRSD